MRRILTTIAALVLIVGTGVTHGVWSGRWSRPIELEAAVARVALAPPAFGDWTSAPHEVTRAMLDQAEIDGHLARQYRDSKGNEFTVLLVCGRPGPISLHTPDVCYEGAGYAAEAAPAGLRVESGSTPAPAFKSARFRNRGTVPEGVLDICWSWNAGHGWEAPDSPRVRFNPGYSRYLYKLYVIRAARPTDPSVAPGRDEFLRDFLRELDLNVTPRVAG